jgi:hypothetical protein
MKRTSNTTEVTTNTDYVAFFCQHLGYTDNPVPAPIAQERCRCLRYSDHICCNRQISKFQVPTGSTLTWWRLLRSSAGSIVFFRVCGAKGKYSCRVSVTGTQ